MGGAEQHHQRYSSANKGYRRSRGSDTSNAAFTVTGGGTGGVFINASMRYSPIPAGTANAVVATSGELELSNGGDTVTLKDATAIVVLTTALGAALTGTDEVSVNPGSRCPQWPDFRPARQHY